MKFKNTENYPKFKIKGKTYYLINKDVDSSRWDGIVDEIWYVKNSICEDFKLLVRFGKTSSYRLYNSKDQCVATTYSVSIEENKV